MPTQQLIRDEVAEVANSIAHWRNGDQIACFDVQEAVVAALMGRFAARPGLYARLVAQGSLRAYIITCLQHAAGDIFGKPLAPLPSDDLLPAPAVEDEPLVPADKARLVFALVRDECEPDAKFALDVIITGCDPAKHPFAAGMSVAAARRHFNDGFTLLRRAVCRAVRRLFGEGVAEEFEQQVHRVTSSVCRRRFRRSVRSLSSKKKEKDMCIQEGHEVSRELRQLRIQHGALWYRQRFGTLSVWARRVVNMFESRGEEGKPGEIIDALARGILGISGRELAPDERRFGALAFLDLIREIRRVFEA